MPPINLPVTRYYGSKRKLIEKIWNVLNDLNVNFDSVLDIFGGSGIFSYYAKRHNKRVIYNDIFKFNSIIGKALIVQNRNFLTFEEAVSLLKPIEGIEYLSIIEDNFEGIYFTKAENRQIDIFIQNIANLEENKKASAYYIIFQACIIKRPYNLFHRNNLNMRINYTNGNFGNKKTWERSFEELFKRFINELDKFNFDNLLVNRSVNFSALECFEQADLIYIDPPYFNNKGHHTTYHSKYHFLEGLANYYEIPNSLDLAKKNKEIQINRSNEFEDPKTFLRDLEILIERYRFSNIVISYRNNGVPTIDQIANLLLEYKNYNNVHVIDLGNYGYALNKTNETNNEFLIIGLN
ncbi:DNA adenine methylase [Chryseobacterium candidae]|uniref:site-specific DNA-methyltransferase (adenine-specific) n=1 Tax=Chryseobacterium candidae TaxID=1978493 RepID=A0ABY2R282_9FLAO|nr:DNA adenine methylase [Chryseobacterium candidae]THV56432.1 DNA methyltransferase [Chryseobacterium candidae]